MTTKKIRRQKQLPTEAMGNTEHTNYITAEHICANCGKAIVMLYPHLWAYKRKQNLKTVYWCSWHCLRESEKGEQNMVKLATEDRACAVRIALEGGNPLKYIRKCGITDAYTTWYHIKQQLKRNDPETFAKLPARLPAAKKDAGITEAWAAEAAGEPEPETKPAERPEAAEKPEKPVRFGDCTVPLKYEGYTVRCIESERFGKWYWDDVHKCLDWTTPYGEEVSMRPEAWRELAETELPQVMAILGVTA